MQNELESRGNVLLILVHFQIREVKSISFECRLKNSKESILQRAMLTNFGSVRV
jgi:hypothetical protein